MASDKQEGGLGEIISDGSEIDVETSHRQFLTQLGHGATLVLKIRDIMHGGYDPEGTCWRLYSAALQRQIDQSSGSNTGFDAALEKQKLVTQISAYETEHSVNLSTFLNSIAKKNGTPGSASYSQDS